MALTATQVQQAYLAYFGRPADVLGLNYWEGQTSAAMTAGFTGSPEFAGLYAGLSPAAQVQQVYQNVLGRSAGSAAITYWGGQLMDGVSISTLVNTIYNTVLNESPTSTDYITVQNRVSYATQFTTMMSTSTPDIIGYNGSAASNAARSALFTAVPSSAVATTTFSSLAADVNSVVNVGSAASATTFTLTTGVDASGTGAFASGLPAGNSKIYGSFNNGASTTFTAGDNIAATGAGNILNLSDNGTGAQYTLNPAATVSGVQTLVINSGEAVALNTKTANAGYTGLTQLTATTVSGGAATNDAFTTGSAVNVTVTDTASGSAAGGVTVDGGNNISVTENGSTTTASAIIIGGTSTTNPAGTVSVTVTGTGNTTVATDGGTGTTVATSQSGAVTIGEYTASTGAVTVTDTNGVSGGGTIAVTGGTAITVTDTAAVTGSGEVGDANAVTATGNSSTGAISVTQTAVAGGLITVDGGTNVTVSTTGNLGTSTVAVGGTTAPTGTVTVTDTNTNSNSADVISVDANSAKDTTGAISVTTTATLGAIAVGTTGSTNGVSGNVTVVNQTVAGGNTTYGTGNVNVYTNGATSVSVTGGGGVTVADQGATAALASVTLSGTQTSASLTGSALTTVTYDNANSSANVSVTNTTASHTETVNINGDTGTGYTAPVFTDSHATTINVVASGAANTLAVTDALAGAVSLGFTNNGTGTLTVGSLALTSLTGTSGTTAGTFTLGGTGAINVGTGFSATYNSNTYATLTQNGTGAVTANVNVGQNFAGGTSSGDAITINGTTTVAISGSIVGGSGGNNTEIFQGDVYTVAQGGTLSGFQNLELSGSGIGANAAGGAAGTWSGAGMTNLIVTGLTQAQVGAGIGNSATFNNVAASTGLEVLAQAATSKATFTQAASTLNNTYTLTIDGQSHTFTETGTLATASLDRVNGIKVTGCTFTRDCTAALSGQGTRTASNRQASSRTLNSAHVHRTGRTGSINRSQLIGSRTNIGVGHSYISSTGDFHGRSLVGRSSRCVVGKRYTVCNGAGSACSHNAIDRNRLVIGFANYCSCRSGVSRLSNCQVQHIPHRCSSSRRESLVNRTAQGDCCAQISTSTVYSRC